MTDRPPPLFALEPTFTDRAAAERSLTDAGAYIAHLLQASPVALMTFGGDGRLVSANQSAANLVGTTLDRLLTQNFRELRSWSESGLLEVAERALETGTEQSIETFITSTYGRSFWFSGRFVPLDFEGQRHLLVVGEDISGRKQAEAHLSAYARAQSLLLSEVNHRVSNNLSAILGIIHLEEGRAAAGNNVELLRTLSAIDNRVRSLAVVHSMLSSREWRPLALGELCRKIVASASLNDSEDGVRVLERDDRVLVTADEAHSLALVLNELATNSFKYARQTAGAPSIEIEVGRRGDEVVLRYRDQGPGFPPEVLSRARSGVGIDLVAGVVEQTLDGRIDLRNDGGAVVEIRFQCITKDLEEKWLAGGHSQP